MTRLVLLQHPIGRIDKLAVVVGAGSIEAATGLKMDQIRRLDDDDKSAIWKAMRGE